MKRVALAVAALIAASAVASSARADGFAEFQREVKMLRPSGFGNTNYGLALDCEPGRCASAQRHYHARYKELQRKHGVQIHPLNDPPFAYAEAVAARVDAREISPPQAESLIQELRLRVVTEISRLQVVGAQADAAAVLLFLQNQRTWMQEPTTITPAPMTPIRCTTQRIGDFAYTTCR